MLTTWPRTSKAKLPGAVIDEPDVVHVDASSSAMKASLYCVPTKMGYSSERNLKSNVRQLAVEGTLRSTFSTETSKSVLPRTFGPKSFTLVNVPGRPAADTTPVVRTP